LDVSIPNTGRVRLSADLAPTVMMSPLSSRRPGWAAEMQQLSAADAELLRMLLAGDANKVVAARLRVSLRTVERRRATVLRKLGVDTLVAAARHPAIAGTEWTDGPPVDPFAAACRDAACGFFVVDAGGRFLRVNDAFCRLIGRSEADLLNLDLSAVTYPDDRERDAARNRAFFAGEFRSFASEKRYVRPEGAAVPVHLVGSLLLGPDGRPRGGLGTVVH